jgi:SAM-dependent methyltransferase
LALATLEHHLQHQLEHAQAFFWHRLRWHIVAEYVPPDRPLVLVDVGAGTGLLGDFLERARPRVSYRFIEPIESLNSRLEDRFGAAANARAVAGVESADVVSVLDVIEHQDDDRAFVAEIVSHMRPGALLLLSVPAQPWLWSEWDAALGHHRRYDKGMFRQLLDPTRVEIRELSYLFPEMVVPALVRKHTRHKETSAAELPELPKIVNGAFYAVGRATLPLRRFIPIGTSLFAAARRTPSS